jgi:hypothetical protein
VKKKGVFEMRRRVVQQKDLVKEILTDLVEMSALDTAYFIYN